MKVIYWKVRNGKVEDLNDLIMKTASIAVPVTLMVFTGNHVYAATSIAGKLKPLITALQDLAEPVSYAFMIYGGIQHAAGRTSEGKKTLKNAIGGYVLVQWLPWIFSIIKSIGN